jgi:sulfite exporter TauE/SafE
MLSTEALYLLYLSTGFTVGFGHCIGMCGPLVVSFSLNLKERSILVPQLLYHLGRITTYAILGGVVAAAGSFTMVAAHLERVQKGVMVFAGILIVLMGFAMAGWLPIARIFGDQTGPGRWISRGFGKLLKIKSTIVYLPLGLLLGLLPCGPVYTALLGGLNDRVRTRNRSGAVFSGQTRRHGLDQIKKYHLQSWGRSDDPRWHLFYHQSHPLLASARCLYSATLPVFISVV